MGFFDRFKSKPSSVQHAGPFVLPVSEVSAALPADGAITVAGLALPAGRCITGDQFDSTVTTPVIWCTTEHSSQCGSWLKQLSREFSASGLWPLALNGLDQTLQRPWLEGELDPDVGALEKAAAIDVRAALAKRWSGSFEHEGDFPGLAQVSAAATDPFEAWWAQKRAAGLGLVAVKRPADVPAVLGWQGPVNWGLNGSEMTAILRSWEDRFGAVLVGLGFATMNLVVARRPRTINEARAVAAEFAAFCPDSVHQGTESLEALAEALVDAPAWHFWWD